MNFRAIHPGYATSAESWRCKHCRRVHPAGTVYAIRIVGDRPWWGCLICAEKPLDPGLRRS